ncbi:MAG: hypothetical protein PUC44_00155 [Eubacteriales bacterium]|nr:hypothetical protein [Eubacteriales bacterium]
MISAEEYTEKYIKGETPEKIQKRVRSLETVIRGLKAAMEMGNQSEFAISEEEDFTPLDEPEFRIPGALSGDIPWTVDGIKQNYLAMFGIDPSAAYLERMQAEEDTAPAAVPKPKKEDDGGETGEPQPDPIADFDFSSYSDEIPEEETEIRSVFKEIESREDALCRMESVRKLLSETEKWIHGAGIPYVPSERERNDEALSRKLNNLELVRFRRGGFALEGFESKIKIHGDEVTYTWEMTRSGLMVEEEDLDKGELSMPKEELLAKLRDFHLGEWEKKYDNFGSQGTEQWELALQFTDQRMPIDFEGLNAYPWNFDEFSDFMNTLN